MISPVSWSMSREQLDSRSGFVSHRYSTSLVQSLRRRQIPTAFRPWDALTGRLVVVGYISRIDNMFGELQLRYGEGESVSLGR